MPVLFKLAQKASLIHGTGLFAEEDIPEGATWWTLDDAVQGIPVLNGKYLPNIIYTEESFRNMKEHTPLEEFKEILANCMYYADGNVAVYLRDGAAKINHSFQANSQLILSKDKDLRKLKSVALRNIKAGEELSEDYSNFTKTNSWLSPYLIQVEPDRLQLEQNLKIQSKKLYDV